MRSSSSNLIVGVVALIVVSSPLLVSSYIAPARLSPWTATLSRTSSTAPRAVSSFFATGRRSVLFLSDEKKAASDEKAVSGSAENPQDIETPSTGFQIGQEQQAIATNVNLGRGGEQQDVKWVDPAMKANTSFQISWWAWALLAWPAFLFANDIFHFVPKEGMIGKFL